MEQARRDGAAAGADANQGADAALAAVVAAPARRVRAHDGGVVIGRPRRNFHRRRCRPARQASRNSTIFEPRPV